MNEHKLRTLEMRRLRDEAERKRARRAQEIADWARILTGLAIMVAVVLGAWLIIREGGRRADEEERKTELIRETIRLNDEAVERISKRPNDGPAWLAFVVGTALLYGGK